MHHNFVNGQFLETKAAETIAVFNPATGKQISEIPDSSAAVVDQAVAVARAATLSCSARSGRFRFVRIAARLT